MIQTGDPTGTGFGGTSIFNKYGAIVGVFHLKFVYAISCVCYIGYFPHLNLYKSY